MGACSGTLDVEFNEGGATGEENSEGELSIGAGAGCLERGKPDSVFPLGSVGGTTASPNDPPKDGSLGDDMVEGEPRIAVEPVAASEIVGLLGKIAAGLVGRFPA